MNKPIDEIRIGIAGLGHRAVEGWIPLLQRIPGYRIVAIYDWIESLHEAGLAAIDYRDDVKRYTNYEDFLADESIDAVGLCVRQPEQGAMAAQALEAGKHVNAEVPMAHRMEDCWRIVLAVERTGCVYQLAEQKRYWSFIDAWRRLVADGQLGVPILCEGQYFGYYGTHQFFQDFKSGKQYSVDQLPDHPEAEPTWLHDMPPIHYLPHELSPILKMLDDRVVEVVAMSTGRPSRSHPEIAMPDMQMALMKTEKDTILRLATAFTSPRPQGDYHWYQVVGTRGRVEWRRTGYEKPKLWLANLKMRDMAEVDWRIQRGDASQVAAGSGHGGADYYVHTAFHKAVLAGEQPDFDVYQAADTAAPAILAGESIGKGTVLQIVPDFRPSIERPAGQAPDGAR